MKHVAIAIISKENVNGKTEYLLIKAKKDFGEFTGFWYPPGGHIENGESEEEALAREVKEELDLEITVETKVAETSGDVKNQITHWWKCTLISGEINIQEEEIAEAQYFTKEEMKDLQIWPATKKFFEEYIFE